MKVYGAAPFVDVHPSDGPPFRGEVRTGWSFDEFEEECSAGGRRLAICKHQHREYEVAWRCAQKLFRKRCPGLANRKSTTEPAQPLRWARSSRSRGRRDD